MTTMSSLGIWITVLIASAVAFGLKFLGFVVPDHYLAHPRVARITSLLPVSLLAALVATQAFVGADAHVVLDSRAVAVAVAFVALACRAPFIVVVILAAATAAGLRALGWS